MSILSKFIGGGVADAVTAVGNVADKLFTSDDERLTHEEIKERLRQQPHLAQIELNKVEAQHRSIFVAGWRPFIGWVCGFGLAFGFIINPVIQWYTGQQGFQLPFEYINSLVLALLGLGSLRSFEKFTGKSK